MLTEARARIRHTSLTKCDLQTAQHTQVTLCCRVELFWTLLNGSGTHDGGTKTTSPTLVILLRLLSELLSHRIPATCKPLNATERITLSQNTSPPDWGYGRRIGRRVRVERATQRVRFSTCVTHAEHVLNSKRPLCSRSEGNTRTLALNAANTVTVLCRQQRFQIFLIGLPAQSRNAGAILSEDLRDEDLFKPVLHTK
jgi:hypothetical protein